MIDQSFFIFRWKINVDSFQRFGIIGSCNFDSTKTLIWKCYIIYLYCKIIVSRIQNGGCKINSIHSMSKMMNCHVQSIPSLSFNVISNKFVPPPAVSHSSFLTVTVWTFPTTAGYTQTIHVSQMCSGDVETCATPSTQRESENWNKFLINPTNGDKHCMLHY